jgi:hypothetical protein
VSKTHRQTDRHTHKKLKSLRQRARDREFERVKGQSEIERARENERACKRARE